MNFSNILNSGFDFQDDSSGLEFRFKILNSIMLIAAIFSFLFALLHDLGINDIGLIHSRVDYFYSVLSVVLILALRQSRDYFVFVASVFLAISFITFVSALIFVLNDEFRIIWFYFVIYVAYILLGSFVGVLMTVLSMAAIIIGNQVTDLQISETAAYTAVLGLLISSLLSRTYTVQMSRYESQLRDKNAQLSRNVAELDEALEQASMANNAKSLFLANISHEIRTPLNGVLGMVQVMQGTSLNEEQQYYIETIELSGNTLLALIDDLLDLTVIESGKLTLNPEPFDTFSWVTQVHNMIEPLFEPKETVLITEISNDLPAYLNGDSSRLLQVVVNLLTNAAKFTPHGEVKLVIDGHQHEKNQYDLYVSVEDTGIGIDSEKLDHIFEPFHQLQDNRISSKGVGLGLAICKRIVDAMGGVLQVESVAGKGSKFIFQVSLPVADRVAAPAPQQRFELKQGLSVLLVDDDPINRLAAHTLLNQRGHEVIEAVNGKEALAMVKDYTFDLILMDVHMPEMDGIEATREIRDYMKNAKQLPIIGLTASVMNDEKPRYLQAGMNDVVEKPIVIDKLMQSIRSL